MASEIGPAKCSRCGNDDAIEIRDRNGWEVSCLICGLFEEYSYEGKLRGYRLEFAIGMAQYTYKDGRGNYWGWHKERCSTVEEMEDALVRLRGLIGSGEIYPESAYVTRWNEAEERVEFLIGGPECLDQASHRLSSPRLSSPPDYTAPF